MRAALARALVGAWAAGFAAAFLPGAAAFRAAADFDAPERAALALAAVLAAARVLVEVLLAEVLLVELLAKLLPEFSGEEFLAEEVLAEEVLAEEVLAEDLAPAALLALAAVRAEDLAAVLPAAPRIEAARPPDFEARPVVAVFAVAVAAFVVALVVFAVLAAPFAPAAFFARVSAEAVLSPAPFVAPRPAADALRFLAVFLLDEGIRGYSFCCPAVETGREAS